MLEVLDRKILRAILGAHSKVPWEMLYLETSVLPISNVITARRLHYLQTILKRSNDEIIRKVYTAQKSNPSKGDWINLVQEDMRIIGLDISDRDIEEMDINKYKDMVKKMVRKQALHELKSIQKGHKKVKHIPFRQLVTPQEYLTSNMLTNKMKSLLFNIRCESLKTIRNNFHKFYNNDITCKLCGTTEIDSQEHLLRCHIVTSKLSPEMDSLWKTVQYQHIYGNTQEQYMVVKVFQALLKIRHRLLKDQQEHRLPRPLIVDQRVNSVSSS